MTGTEFVGNVKVKLNRLDSNAYADILQEEILFFGTDALKKLTLKINNGRLNYIASPETLLVYLAGLIKVSNEIELTDNKVAIPEDVLLIKDIVVEVTADGETAWVPGRLITTRISESLHPDPFTRSYPDKPGYEMLGGNINFPIVEGDFVCNKIRIEYLIMPDELQTTSTINFPFTDELEDETVTLILENLESRRLQSQPTVSKS